MPGFDIYIYFYKVKTVLEEIKPDENSSFRLMVNPNLSDFFFWHFHPEYELVFIDGANGTRHVGEHISRFEESDLVFIGPNIPHLNFDYGVKTFYEKIVVHINPGFLVQALQNTPELEGVRQLFDISRHGVAFGTETKALIGNRLKKLHTLNHFDQFIEMMSIFQILANSKEKELLHGQPVENQYTQKDQERLKRIYAYVDANYQTKIEIGQVANLSNLTNEAFCRYFRKMTKLTFTQFVNHYRVDTAKKLLILDKNITEACYECGFESLSYFNRIFKKVTGENPLAFKKRYVKHTSAWTGGLVDL